MASTLSEDSAPSASLDCLKAQAAPTHPRAQPEPLGSLRWPQELASDRPKVEDFPLSTNRHTLLVKCVFDSWLLATNNKENMLQWAASLHAAQPSKKTERAVVDSVLAQGWLVQLV